MTYTTKCIRSLYGADLVAHSGWLVEREDLKTLENTGFSQIPKDRIPEPFWALPHSASVFMLTTNPGHGPDFDSPQARQAFNELMLAMRKQELSMGQIQQFYRSELVPASARDWYQKNQGPFAYNQKICNLRLFAYPSVTKSGLPAKFLANPNSLPSTRKILELVHGYLVPKALTGQIGLAVMSSPVEWGFPKVEDDVVNNGLFISRAGIRNTSICGPRMRGFITRFIGKPPLGAGHENTHQEAAE